MPEVKEHPLLKSTRREAIAAFVIWFCAMVYTVGYCSLYGYHRDPNTLTYVLGFPDWVFWGLVVPWGTCTVIATLFAFCFMKDEDLGDVGDPTIIQDNAPQT